MTKIKIVGALVFSLSIVLAFLFNYVDNQNNISKKLLDTINQQKAFTQEISKNIFYIYNNKNASCSQLDSSIRSFIINMDSRDKQLSHINSTAIRKQSSKIILLWNNFYLEVQNFRNINKVTTPYSSIISEKLVNKIYNINLDLIIEFDKLIDIHQQELEEKIFVYKSIEYFLFFLLVAFLIYLFSKVKEVMIFIQKFITTSKKVISNSSIKEIEPIKVEASCTNENISNATNNFNFLINKINNSIEHSCDSIEHSYNSLELVENNIEDFLELIYQMDDDKKPDKELTKKEDEIIQTLEELTSAAQHLKELKLNLDSLLYKSKNQ